MEAGELFPKTGIDTPAGVEERQGSDSEDEAVNAVAPQGRSKRAKEQPVQRRTRKAAGPTAEAVAEALQQGTAPVVAMLRKGSRKRKERE